MPVADERGRGRSIGRLTPPQMPVGALPLMMSVSVCGLAVRPSLFWLGWQCLAGVQCDRDFAVNVCERRRSTG